MNKIGYPQCDDYMREQLPDVDHQKYEAIPVFLYVTDRCNRE